MLCSVKKKAQKMRAKAKKRNGTNGTGGLPSLQPLPKGLTGQKIRMTAETIKRSVYTFHSIIFCANLVHGLLTPRFRANA
jgi:hypothetical protein